MSLRYYGGNAAWAKCRGHRNMWFFKIEQDSEKGPGPTAWKYNSVTDKKYGVNLKICEAMSDIGWDSNSCVVV